METPVKSDCSQQRQRQRAEEQRTARRSERARATLGARERGWGACARYFEASAGRRLGKLRGAPAIGEAAHHLENQRAEKQQQPFGDEEPAYSERI
jgi:hypothetical protein